jgi:energy-coupling factor transport system ATP-binding protein
LRIQAEHLSYTYNAKSPFAVAALKDVSLTVEEGDFFGVIGHTGSGKSTFVQHLNGLLRLPSSLKRRYRQKVKRGQTPPPLPQLRVGDFDLADRKTDFRALRGKVGMVFQYPEYQLFAETVASDVAFGYKNFAKKKPTDEEIESAVRAALGAVGLDYLEIKDKSPFDLSGGQKRRVAIAGVIVSRPEVLVLDEPAAGLDPAGKREVMELLHRLHKEWCKTVVVVSHDMDEIAENCNRVAVFSEGEVKFVLPPCELFEKSEELTALGLDVPLTAKLTFALRERGLKIKNDFTAEGFIKSVLDCANNMGESE